MRNKFGTQFDYDGTVKRKDSWELTRLTQDDGTPHTLDDKDKVIQDLCTDYNNLSRLYNVLVRAIMSSRQD